MSSTPTVRQIWEEEWEEIHRDVYRDLHDSWLPGNRVRGVFKHPEDGTFWAVNYQEDGEWNDMGERPELLDAPREVVKVEVARVEYREL